MKSLCSRLLIIAALVVFIVPLSAKALTVSPVKLEVQGNPGQTVGGEFLLFNEQLEAKTFYSSFENFEAQGEEGAPVFKPGTEDLATWLQTLPEVILEAGEQRKIPFTIAIPVDATPGGHFAAIFFGTTPTQKTELGSQVAVGAKIGILVLLRVTGDVAEGGGLLDFQLTEKKPFFENLPIGFTYRFSNSGGDRIKPDGDLVIKNLIGMKKVSISANASQGNVLPGSIRKFEVSWEGSNPAPEEPTAGIDGLAEKIKRQWTDFAFGRYTAELNLVYGAENTSAAGSVSFWVLPWQLLIAMALVILVGGAVLIKGIKTYNAWIIRSAKIKRPRKKRA